MLDEMCFTRMGNQYFHDMMLHIDSSNFTNIFHSMFAKAFNVHDSKVNGYWLHGKERRLHEGSAYCAQTEVMHVISTDVCNFTKVYGFRYSSLTEDNRSGNSINSRVRARFEH